MVSIELLPICQAIKDFSDSQLIGRGALTRHAGSFIAQGDGGDVCGQQLKNHTYDAGEYEPLSELRPGMTTAVLLILLVVPLAEVTRSWK